MTVPSTKNSSKAQRVSQACVHWTESQTQTGSLRYQQAQQLLVSFPPSQTNKQTKKRNNSTKPQSVSQAVSEVKSQAKKAGPPTHTHTHTYDTTSINPSIDPSIDPSIHPSIACKHACMHSFFLHRFCVATNSTLVGSMLHTVPITYLHVSVDILVFLPVPLRDVLFQIQACDFFEWHLPQLRGGYVRKDVACPALLQRRNPHRVLQRIQNVQIAHREHWK